MVCLVSIKNVSALSVKYEHVIKSQPNVEFETDLSGPEPWLIEVYIYIH